MKFELDSFHELFLFKPLYIVIQQTKRSEMNYMEKNVHD